MINLVYHQEDFKFEVEWHFFATSVGYNLCDGWRDCNAGGSQSQFESEYSSGLGFGRTVQKPGFYRSKLVDT